MVSSTILQFFCLIILLTIMIADQHCVQAADENKIEAFVGSWKLLFQKNTEDYLKSIGIESVPKGMLESFTPEIHITMDGKNNLNMTTSVIVKTHSTNVRFNEELAGETIDGRKAKTTHTMEGNKWISTERWLDVKSGKEKMAKYTRVISNGQLIITIVIEQDGVVSIQRYARIH